jgi:transcription elongation factor GreA
VTVVLEDVETEEELEYRIVGDLESDVKAGTISISSPIARAVIGKEVGDDAVVRTPKGERRFVINDVLYR